MMTIMEDFGINWTIWKNKGVFPHSRNPELCIKFELFKCLQVNLLFVRIDDVILLLFVMQIIFPSHQNFPIKSYFISSENRFALSFDTFRQNTPSSLIA